MQAEHKIPLEIAAKIEELRSILNDAIDLREDILAWYDSELKSFEPDADHSQELFSPDGALTVTSIDDMAILEVFNELQIAKECK